MSSAEDLGPSRDYLNTYGLTCEPFADARDGRFFYAGAALMQRLDLLSHLTQFGDAAILVAGPSGSGKSTLLARFVAERAKQWRLCAIHAEEFEHFEQRLGDALGIGESASPAQLLSQWASQSDVSQLAVIVIDDAQQLPAQALQTLRDLLTQAQGSRLRLIAFLTPPALAEVRQALEAGAAPANTQLLEIPKLSEEETAAYLMYRLAVAGYSGESPFNATEVRAICKAADGRPGAINRLAHEAMQEHQMRAGGKTARAAPPRPGKRTAWGVALVLTLGLAAYLGWQSQIPQPPTGSPAPPRSGGEETRPLFLPKEPPQDTRAATGQAERPPPAEAPAPATVDTEAAAATTQPPVPPTAITPSPRADSVLPAETAPADIQAADPAAAAQSPLAAGRDTAPPAPDRSALPGNLEAPGLAEAPPPATPHSPETSVENPPPSTPGARAGVTESPRGAATATSLAGASTPPVAPTEAQKPTQSAAPSTQAPAAATPDGATPAARPDASGSEPSPATTPHREDWLLQQPSDHFTLQLLGSRQQASILRYIRANGLDPARSAYYRGVFQGGDWYVLVYGAYPDRAAALAARAQLPARVQREKPWPRSLADVHQAIRGAP